MIRKFLKKNWYNFDQKLVVFCAILSVLFGYGVNLENNISKGTKA